MEKESIEGARGAWFLFAVAALALGATIAFSASTVIGHTKEQEGAVYKVSRPAPTMEVCTRNLARVTHGNYQNGFLRGWSRSAQFEPVFTQKCKLARNEGPGKIKMTFWYFWKRYNSGSFSLCWAGGTHFNQNTTFEVTRYRDWVNRPCGRGYYRSKTRADVKIAGTFQGGALESGNHNFGA